MNDFRITSIFLIVGLFVSYLLSSPLKNTGIEQAGAQPVQNKPEVKLAIQQEKTVSIQSLMVDTKILAEPLNGESQQETIPAREYIQLSVPEQHELEPLNVVRQVTPLLEKEHAAVPLSMVEFISEINHPDVLTVLMDLLNDARVNIRIAALEALVMHNDPELTANFEPLLYDQNKEVRIAAVEAIGILEREESVYMLSGLLMDADQDVRLKAVNAMGEIGGDEAYSYLGQLIYDPNNLIRENALAILEESNN